MVEHYKANHFLADRTIDEFQRLFPYRSPGAPTKSPYSHIKEAIELDRAQEGGVGRITSQALNRLIEDTSVHPNSIVNSLEQIRKEMPLPEVKVKRTGLGGIVDRVKEIGAPPAYDSVDRIIDDAVHTISYESVKTARDKTAFLIREGEAAVQRSIRDHAAVEVKADVGLDGKKLVEADAPGQATKSTVLPDGHGRGGELLRGGQVVGVLTNAEGLTLDEVSARQRMADMERIRTNNRMAEMSALDVPADQRVGLFVDNKEQGASLADAFKAKGVAVELVLLGDQNILYVERTGLKTVGYNNNPEQFIAQNASAKATSAPAAAPIEIPRGHARDGSVMDEMGNPIKTNGLSLDEGMALRNMQGADVPPAEHSRVDTDTSTHNRTPATADTHKTPVDTPSKSQEPSQRGMRGIGAAGLASRANALKDPNMGVDEKLINGSAIAADSVEIFSKSRIGTKFGIAGNMLGVVADTYRGSKEDGLEGAAREGSASVVNTGSALAVFLDRGKNLLGKGNAVGGVSGFAGKAGLTSAAATAVTDAKDYLTGRKELTTDNAYGTVLDTTVNFDPLKAVTGLVGGVTQLIGIDTGIQNISISSLMDRGLGVVGLTEGKGEQIGDVKNEIQAIYKELDTTIEARMLEERHRRKDESDPNKPLMTDYAHLATIRGQLVKFIPNGKIDGHDVRTEFDQIDFTDRKNQGAYKMAINDYIIEQSKIRDDNGSMLPRWLSSGKSAMKHEEAKIMLNELNAVEGEFAMFQARTSEYTQQKAEYAVRQAAAEGAVHPELRNNLPVKEATNDPHHNLTVAGKLSSSQDKYV